VANGYGGRDAGFIAHACPAGGMHITVEDLIVEIVDERGRPLPTGEAGEVVITHLYSTGFPFVRYKNGDVAALDERQCPCGRGLPLLGEIHGRSNDLLRAENGAAVHGIAFAALLRDMPGVNGFKVIQETLQHCRLQLVTDARYQAAVCEPGIHDTFRLRLGEGVRLDIEYVTVIEPEKSGKYRYVVSRLGELQT
jgi:phenylacetate-CoA ligase